MKSKSFLVTCIIIVSTLMLISCGKNAATSNTTTNVIQTSQPSSSVTTSLSNTVNIKVTTTIAVSNGTGALAYDPSENDLFVINGGNLPVSVISDATNAIAQGAFGGTGANYVVYDSGKNEFFVTSNKYYNGWIVSGSTFAQVGTITVPPQGIYIPAGIVYDSNKNEIFVADGGGKTLLVIDDSTGNVLNSIPMTSGPGGLAYDSGKNEIFAVSGNNVSVFSDSTNSLLATVTLQTQSDPYALAYDSNKNEVFAAFNQSL
jgi:DNA-binding beta-propeller fold protein YncE